MHLCLSVRRSCFASFASFASAIGVGYILRIPQGLEKFDSLLVGMMQAPLVARVRATPLGARFHVPDVLLGPRDKYGR